MKPRKSSGQKWEDLGQLALDVRHIARQQNIPVLTAMQGLSVIDMTANLAKVRDGQKGQFDISAMFANMKMEEVVNATF